MKIAAFALCLFSVMTSLNAMDNTALRQSSDQKFHYFDQLPNDIRTSIFQCYLSEPISHDNDQETYVQLKSFAARVCRLQTICKTTLSNNEVFALLDPGITDKNKDRYLIFASHIGMPFVLKQLIEKYSFLPCNYYYKTDLIFDCRNGSTVLTNAVRGENYQCAKLLLEIDRLHHQEEHVKPYHFVPILVNLGEQDPHYKPIHLAAMSGNIKIMQLLEEYGADITARTSDNEDVLSVASNLDSFGLMIATLFRSEQDTEADRKVKKQLWFEFAQSKFSMIDYLLNYLPYQVSKKRKKVIMQLIQKFKQSDIYRIISEQ